MECACRNKDGYITGLCGIHSNYLSKQVREQRELLLAEIAGPPIPLILHCPDCGERHVDRGEFATKLHHTHACQQCGFVWRPSLVNTVGVHFLPGFKDEL